MEKYDFECIYICMCLQDRQNKTVLCDVLLYSFFYQKKNIFNSHKYFRCFTQPITVCVNKALYKKQVHIVGFKNDSLLLLLLLLALLLLPYIITIELTHSKTVLENTVEIEPQPVALDFNNLSQYSSSSK